MKIMKNKLTFMQELVLDSIKKYYQDNYKSPTLIELCDMVGLYAKSTIHQHLKNLEKKGYIKIEKKKKRGIVLIEKK